PSAAYLRPPGEPLDRGDATKIAEPHAADGLVAGEREEMAAGEVVAVELLVVGAVLLAHVDYGADGEDLAEFLDAVRDLDADGLLGRGRDVRRLGRRHRA